MANSSKKTYIPYYLRIKNQTDWDELEKDEQKRIRRAPHKRQRQLSKQIINNELKKYYGEAS